MSDEGDDKLCRVVTKKIASAEGECTGCHHVAICAPTSVQTQREFLPSSVHRHHSWHRLASAPVLALEMHIMRGEALGIAPGNGAAPAAFDAAGGGCAVAGQWRGAGRFRQGWVVVSACFGAPFGALRLSPFGGLRASAAIRRGPHRTWGFRNPPPGVHLETVLELPHQI
jgi:hypothetical protein